MQIAYLVEPVNVTNTGVLQGKSLRTYEVQVDFNSSNSGWKRKVIPTGKVFTIKNGQIISKTTKATLSDKFVSSYTQTKISSNINDLKTSWGSALFATPELGLLAKAYGIRSAIAKTKKQLQEYLDTIESTEDSIEDTSFLFNKYPELLI
ncbi:MAG: hypothetical protein PVF17_01530 [Ignavibacteria bacterium]|jgi:hypothetical protein